MGITTGIEYCDSTLNLQMGCNGCELWQPKKGEHAKRCYAGRMTEWQERERRNAKKPQLLHIWPAKFESPELFVDRLDAAEKWPDLTGKRRPEKPWLNGLPRIVFLNDMGDTFTESLPLFWLAPSLARMARLPFIFLLLTKRTNRMRLFSEAHPFPDNFWLLASVTSAATADRIGNLAHVQGGSLRGISYEPALGPVDFRPYFGLAARPEWIIAGGESGNGAIAPSPQWFRAVRDHCGAAGVPYFFKQWGNLGQQPGPVTAKHRALEKIHGTAGRLLDGEQWSQLPSTYTAPPSQELLFEIS